MKRFENIFTCPVCGGDMKIVSSKSLVCVNGHLFDLAKQGYVNLTTHPVTVKYDKKLFTARKTVMDSGFFTPLIKQISEYIKKEFDNNQKINILDAGCGEGSHLAAIKNNIDLQHKSAAIVGIDLAKEGISKAAKNHPEIIWCVADLANSPFKDHTFHVILNILSPANYTEFHRLLNENGIVMKVIPQRDYLKELREIFFAGQEKQAYSSENTQEIFSTHFEVIEKQPLRYCVNVDQSTLEPLIRMTPLSWGAKEEKIQSVLESQLDQITVDFVILIGKKKIRN
ncbi:methyltransferase domain-containing protein [Bacillaceae bacterium Marseille-Q3522]|nr:methyltransferase domain-containing protein [Bacillaceae bacterium Marseille-Q3522]